MRTQWACAFKAMVMIVAGTFGLFECTQAGEAPRGGESIHAAPPSVDELMMRDIAGIPNKEALMLTVTYLPGGASLPHRHDAQVFVYVLEGTMTMQVDGSAPVTVAKGQTFYEGPLDVHRVSANASRTEDAKLLVFMIKDKGRPASRGLGQKEVP